MLEIVIHTLPQEIDQLEQILVQLKRNAERIITTKEEFVVNVNLNLNLVDWHESEIPIKFFLNKFENLEKLTETWAQTKFVNFDYDILGCVSHRRKAINETKADALVFLDTDIIFSDNLLYYLWYSSKEISQPYYILTPQIPKNWDNSWDCLVHKAYIHNSDREYITRDPYKYAHTCDDVKVTSINQFKFGGGWATLISTPLAKKIGIPESLGHYGLEDTYMMYCCEMMKQKGENIQQYILENEIICEDHIFRFNPYKDYLITIDRRKEFLEQANKNFQQELQNFYSKT